MKCFLGAISILLLFSSCLKKIEEVDNANTNIYDPDYVGEQWWVYENVNVFTDGNNNQKVALEYSVSEEKAPGLNSPKINLAVLVNSETDTIYASADINTSGDYSGSVIINYNGAANYCMEIGVFTQEGLTINSFEECKSL
ncbi:MAG: hypothetical protein WDZ35_13300 [Crocinitomicaceae bacterium]